MSRNEAAPARLGGVLLLGLGWVLLGCLLVGLIFAAHKAQHSTVPATTPPAGADATGFQPPPESAIPDGPDGDAIRRGKAIFLDPAKYARAYVGSSLTCGNCHLDAGRQANASPMWAAWGKYPAYRSKNGRINTMEDRIMGCFIYSMNAQGSPSGKPPPAGDDIYRDLEAYFAWLATGAPVGADLPGRGYLKLEKTALGMDPARGKEVFAQHCAVCHGVSGQGQPNGDGSYSVPPLWGAHSFNWGAGMGRVANAAGFIKANMPFGQGYSLTDQQAWDVAAYVDSQERPPDPRQQGTTIAATREAHHDSGDYYGQVIAGDLLGDGVVKP